MAADVGVDLRGVGGSGPGGRIVKQDITRAAQPPVPAHASASCGCGRAPAAQGCARHYRRAHGSQRAHHRPRHPRDGSGCHRVRGCPRAHQSQSVEEWGFAPGYNDLLAKIVAAALRKFPYMNARLAPDAIEILGHVNIGMAVETDRGLLVPVIKDADQKGSAPVRGRIPPTGGRRPHSAVPCPTT